MIFFLCFYVCGNFQFCKINILFKIASSVILNSVKDFIFIVWNVSSYPIFLKRNHLKLYELQRREVSQQPSCPRLASAEPPGQSKEGKG